MKLRHFVPASIALAVLVIAGCAAGPTTGSTTTPPPPPAAAAKYIGFLNPLGHFSRDAGLQVHHATTTASNGNSLFSSLASFIFQSGGTSTGVTSVSMSFSGYCYQPQSNLGTENVMYGLGQSANVSCVNTAITPTSGVPVVLDGTLQVLSLSGTNAGPMTATVYVNGQKTAITCTTTVKGANGLYSCEDLTDLVTVKDGDLVAVTFKTASATAALENNSVMLGKY